MNYKNQTVSELILSWLTNETVAFPGAYEKPYHFIQRFRKLEKQRYDSAIWKLRRSGKVALVIKNNQKFLQCTKKGQLAFLLEKAGVKKTKTWDGKWRLVMFDIPEEHRDKRGILRSLLKQKGFVQLQQSVFVNPYPFNREALDYLRKTGLIRFIRMMRVDDMDDESELKEKFALK